MRSTGHDDGFAMIAVVLLTAVAAGLVLTMVVQATATTRRQVTNVDRSSAVSAAADMRIRLEDRLRIDPLFFYSETWEFERARVCTAGDGRVVEPSNPWPASCGTVWEYQDPAVASDVTVDLAPPSADDPTLKATITASSGDRSATFVTTYVPASPSRFAFAATQGLDVSALPASSLVSGELYSGGTMTLPDSSVTVTDAWLDAETGFSPDPSTVPAGADPTNRFYTSLFDLGADPPLRDLRSVLNVPLTEASLRALYPTLTQLACPSGTPHLVGSRASWLCLQTGGEVVAADGTTETLPSDVLAWLLVFSAPDRVDVYTSDVVSEAPDCSDCPLPGQSNASVNNGTHPGGYGYWTLFDSLPVPASGLIFTDTQTHIGLCGDEFAGSGGTPCHVWSGTQPGMAVDSSFTVLAGTFTHPADVFLSGPATPDAGVAFGAVATGSVLVPYWARASEVNLTVHGAYMAFGLGSSEPAFRTFPTTVDKTNSANLAPLLVWDGSVTAPEADLSLGLFEQVDVTGAPSLWRLAPPLFPAGAWRPSGTVRTATQ